MTEKRALTGFITGVVLLELLVIKGLALLGADSETQVAAYVLLLSVAGFGTGFIVTHYH